MRRKLKRILALAVALVLAFSAVPGGPRAGAAYTAPYTTVRVGLYVTSGGTTTQKSYPSANLQNSTGSGYELGWFDADRNFHSLGVFITDTTEITMLMDRTMTYSAGSNSYSEGSGGDVVVGCVHLRLPGSYESYAEAQAVAAGLADGFVRYENGSFVVLMGQYVSSAAASDAKAKLGLDAAVDSGTSHTVTVVRTRTNRILFEYDCGTLSSLAVRPLAPKGVKAETWFKGDTYYGAFAYLRNSGGNLTVVNYVDVEDYIKGVVPWEMSASWPIEALKAQAISARTFVMYNINKHRSSGFDVCNTTDCQAYHGTERANANSDAAVDGTRSQYLTYKGALCSTTYCSSDGGATENSENVWTGKFDYLQGVVDPYEKDVAGIISDYYWQTIFTPASLGKRLQEKGYKSGNVARIEMSFTQMGNVYSITFIDVNGRRNTISKSAARTVLGLRSQRYSVNGLGAAGQERQYYVNAGAALEGGLEGAFAVGAGGAAQIPSGDVYAISGSGTVSKVGNAPVSSGSVGVDSRGYFVFSGSGWGHNVGMSQWGAYSMAKNYNKTCAEILTFYYSGTQVVTSPRTEQLYIPAPQGPALPPETQPPADSGPAASGETDAELTGSDMPLPDGTGE